MRRFALISIWITSLLFITDQLQAQFIMTDTLVTECEGTLSDSEMGPEEGQYDHNEDYTFTICVERASSIMATFNFFATESTYDVLTIYDGPDTNAPIINQLDGVISLPPIIVANSGCMTFHFISDDNIVAQGWLLEWEVEIEEFADPELEITSQLDCPLGSMDFSIDTRIPCEILVPDNFQLLGPDAQNISSVIPLDCDSDNRVSEFTINFADSLSLSGNYNLIFNGYIVSSCGDTLTFESLIGFELKDCPFQVEIKLVERACVGECGLLEVSVNSTDDGPFSVVWSHTSDDTEKVDICTDTAIWVNIFVQNLSNGTTGSDQFLYEPYSLPQITNPFLSDTFCSSQSTYLLKADVPDGRWNSRIMDNTKDAQYRFFRFNTQDGLQRDVISYTDVNGCSTLDTVYIIPIYAGRDQAVCLSQPTLQLAGNNPDVGVWDGPNTTPDGIFTTTEADTFWISYTNSVGCKNWKRVFVTEDIEFSNLDTLCSRSEIDLRLHVNSLGGRWSGPGITNWYIGRLQPWKANLDTWNRYTYEIEGCIDTLDIYIKGIWAGPDRTICSSTESIQLDFNGSWSGPGQFNPLDSTYDISGVNPGVYDIVGVKEGCTDKFRITIHDVNVELKGTELYCHDANRVPIEDIINTTPKDGTLSGNGVVDDQGNLYFDPSLVSGDQGYVVFEALNCFDTVVIDVEQELDIDDIEFCEFSKLKTLDKMGFEGYWEGPGILNPVTGLINIEALNPGSNEIRFISEKGCATPIIVDLIGFQEAQILDVVDSYCYQDTNYFLTLLPNDGTFTINGIESLPQINPSLLGSGYHEIEYIVGVDECEDKMSTFIAVEEPISGFTYANFDTLCPDESTSIFVEAYGGVGPIAAVWDSGLGFGKSHIVFPVKSSDYKVILSDGCSDDITLDLRIHVYDTFRVIVNYGPEVCYGDSSFIELELDDPNNYSITWDEEYSPNGQVYESDPGIYLVKLLQISSGCEQKYELEIPGAEPLGAGFTIIPNQDCIDLVNNELEILDLGYGYSDGYMTFGELDERVNLLTGPLEYTYDNIGVYDVTQVVFNDLGCSDTLVQSICVENVVQLFVPNIFSPNEDGKNDFLTIHTLGIKDFYIRIFDRWGNEMFQSNDVSQSWDGRFNGRSVDPGVYMIMIEYTDQDTEEKFVKYFDLALIR